ncbi:hypothetical protein [Leptothoe spongobia]|uniref:Uncharacterized protein n=1 Tax=Leptothoe spongobia TAU-MAC 1115 TaxID=1967444 RepID=A0A947DG90_9CYAN|nr:hypothetical protein [Leptothoe spongobia]MBT9316370.1 hypothetical protein [Leptothoe spongobia TAU-MAC 1115]
MQVFINQLPLIITILTALAGVIGWGIGRVRRGYGLERDINHLKRDYETLSTNCSKLFTELERRLDQAEKELAILKAVNQALIAQGPRSQAEHVFRECDTA